MLFSYMLPMHIAYCFWGVPYQSVVSMSSVFFFFYFGCRPLEKKNSMPSEVLWVFKGFSVISIRYNLTL